MLTTRARWEQVRGTSVGLKWVMAVSGAVMSGWLLLHMIGNSLVFLGPAVINGYGAVLQASPLLWILRAGLLVALVAHVGAAAAVTRRSRGARQDRYRRGLTARLSTVSSRSMRWGGVAVGLFLVYHLLHIYGPLHASFVPGDVHHNLVAGLADPLVSAVYVAATLAMGMHLHHGTWSLFRTLGWARADTGVIGRGSAAFSVVVTAGLLAPCVAALAGWL